MTSSTWVPFKLILELKTSVLMPEHPICLDSVLASLLDMRFSGFERVERELNQLLMRTDGIYHASSMLFGLSQDTGAVTSHTPVVRIVRGESDLDSRLFAPTGTKGRYNSVRTYDGPMKNRVVKERAVWAPCLIFYGMGDIEKIARYFQHCAIGIGRNSNRGGSGSIGRVRYQHLENDHSLVDPSGNPNRPLPLKLFRQLTGRKQIDAQSVPTRFPYFLGESREIGVIPEVYRSELLAELNLALNQ